MFNSFADEGKFCPVKIAFALPALLQFCSIRTSVDNNSGPLPRGGIRGQCPKIVLCPQNFVRPENFFKLIIKTKILHL